MNIGNFYQEGIEEVAFLLMHFWNLSSLPDDAINDRDNLQQQIEKSQNAIYERKCLFSSAVSAFDKYGAFTEYYDRSDLEEKKGIYTFPS
eukprot:2405543-Ditylum_brightwellii.AAC.1